ncbi:MAG: sugar phosphate isomerase/epimerase family protein [Sphaerochaetaceae bacterium]
MQGSEPFIGIKLLPCKTPEELRKQLGRLQRAGFDGVEFALDMFPLIIGGEICPCWADLVGSVLKEFPLGYSAHIGRGLDMREKKDIAIHWNVLKSSIELCHWLGANPLVLHYEVQTDDSLLEKQFYDYHVRAADKAAELGVTLCIENIEVERMLPVIEMVSTIRHPNLKMTLDTGHGFLASRHFGFDYLEMVEKAVPWVGHVHVNDNMGIFDPLRIDDRVAYDVEQMGYRRTFGRGDIHVPPFFGKVPLDGVFHFLRDYREKFICEYTTESFVPFDAAVSAAVRRHIIEAR